MTPTAARSLHAAVPVPPPPRGDGDAEGDAPAAFGSSSQPPAPPRPPAADEPAQGAPPRAVPAPGVSQRAEHRLSPGSDGVATGALVADRAPVASQAGVDARAEAEEHSADGPPTSVLDLDTGALDAGSFTRPQTSRPPRPRPVQPPTSIDEATLRRQRAWVIAITVGFGAVSVAVLASWFV